VAGPRPIEELLEKVAVELIGDEKERNNQKSGGSSTGSATYHQPDPGTDDKNPEGPLFIPVSDDRPENVTYRVRERPVEKEEKRPVQAVEEINQLAFPSALFF
jgi:hypothetical protein